MADIKQIKVSNVNYNFSGAAIVLEDNGTTTAGTWLAKTSQVSALVDGQIFLYKITKAGASTTTLNITGSAGTALGAKTIYRNATNKLTTHYGVGEYVLLTYNSADTCFRVINDYDANSTNFVRYDTNAQGLDNTQKSNARTNIGAGTSNLAIGTTASTAAAGNHAHGLSSETSSATGRVEYIKKVSFTSGVLTLQTAYLKVNSNS